MVVLVSLVPLHTEYNQKLSFPCCLGRHGLFLWSSWSLWWLVVSTGISTKTHPHRKSAEYGSHVISNAKSTLYQGLRSGRRSSPGTAPMSCRRCSPASFGEPF